MQAHHRPHSFAIIPLDMHLFIIETGVGELKSTENLRKQGISYEMFEH